MDFQGQGQAITGETEALAVIDSFTKSVSVIALPNRSASTLAPRLLDEIFFRRGAPDILHCDEAQEFMSELLSLLLDATGTARTKARTKLTAMEEKRRRAEEEAAEAAAGDARARASPA